MNHIHDDMRHSWERTYASTTSGAFGYCLSKRWSGTSYIVMEVSDRPGDLNPVRPDWSQSESPVCPVRFTYESFFCDLHPIPRILSLGA